MPHAYVEMNPEDAAAHGFANGETILVKTRRGELALPVWLNGRGRPPRGSLFVPFFDQRLLVNNITLGDTEDWGKEVGFLLGPTRSQGEDSFIAESMHLATLYRQHSILTHKGFHIVDTGEVTPVTFNIRPVPEPTLLTFKDPLFAYQSAFNGSATGVTLVCPLDPTFRPYFLEAIP